jgi:hypothetical protein
MEEEAGTGAQLLKLMRVGVEQSKEATGHSDRGGGRGGGGGRRGG